MSIIDMGESKTNFDAALAAEKGIYENDYADQIQSNEAAKAVKAALETLIPKAKDGRNSASHVGWFNFLYISAGAV